MSCGLKWPISCCYKRKKYFTGTQSHPFFYMLSIAGFAVKQQNLITVTETIWVTKPKLFTIWPFTEKVC